MSQVAHASPELAPEPADYLKRILPEEAEEIRSYLRATGGGGGGGGGSLVYSSFGAQMEHLELYAFRASPCVRCGGSRTRHTGGCGFVASSRKGREINQRQRDVLAVLGIELATNMLPPRADRICKKCGGRGWVKPANPSRSSKKAAITARPSGSSKHGVGPSVSLDGGDTDLMARVGRRMSEVHRLSAREGEALVCWFSAPRNEGGMSIRCLWHLTSAGKTLLRRNHLELTPAAFFENERRDQLDKPDPNRQRLFLAADAQAEELWTSTCALWNDVSTSDQGPARAASIVPLAPVTNPPTEPAGSNE